MGSFSVISCWLGHLLIAFSLVIAIGRDRSLVLVSALFIKLQTPVCLFFNLYIILLM